MRKSNTAKMTVNSKPKPQRQSILLPLVFKETNPFLGLFRYFSCPFFQRQQTHKIDNRQTEKKKGGGYSPVHASVLFLSFLSRVSLSPSIYPTYFLSILSILRHIFLSVFLCFSLYVSFCHSRASTPITFFSPFPPTT